MRCPGLVLIPDRHAEVCLVGLTRLTTCFHGTLSRSCLYKLSTHVANCIGWVQTTSWCHLNQLNYSSTTIRYSRNNNNINRNVGSSHLCFYTCMTSLLLDSPRTFWKVLKVS